MPNCYRRVACAPVCGLSFRTCRAVPGTLVASWTSSSRRTVAVPTPTAFAP